MVDQIIKSSDILDKCIATKDKALIISTIVGAILASFALYELLKRKKDELYHKVKEVKIDKSTKLTVEKRDEAGQKEQTKTKEKENIGKEQKKEQPEKKQEAKKEE